MLGFKGYGFVLDGFAHGLGIVAVIDVFEVAEFLVGLKHLIIISKITAMGGLFMKY